MITKEELIAFEEEIAELFNSGQIRAPVHLDNGNEEALFNVFEFIKPDDWCLCSWRSHYKCLLKGVPREHVKEKILAGQSISLCFPEYRVLSSAIVGGVIPIAVGLGIAIKAKEGKNKVIVFSGDMSAECGIMHEAVKYCSNWKLPVLFVIEDNDKSVCTPTRQTWGMLETTYEYHDLPNVVHFKYESKWPHAGAGQRINF